MGFDDDDTQEVDAYIRSYDFGSQANSPKVLLTWTAEAPDELHFSLQKMHYTRGSHYAAATFKLIEDWLDTQGVRGEWQHSQQHPNYFGTLKLNSPIADHHTLLQKAGMVIHVLQQHYARTQNYKQALDDSSASLSRYEQKRYEEENERLIALTGGIPLSDITLNDVIPHIQEIPHEHRVDLIIQHLCRDFPNSDVTTDIADGICQAIDSEFPRGWRTDRDDNTNRVIETVYAALAPYYQDDRQRHRMACGIGVTLCDEMEPPAETKSNAKKDWNLYR